jgi:hypothetical protein
MVVAAIPEKDHKAAWGAHDPARRDGRMSDTRTAPLPRVSDAEGSSREPLLASQREAAMSPCPSRERNDFVANPTIRTLSVRHPY